LNKIVITETGRNILNHQIKELVIIRIYHLNYHALKIFVEVINIKTWSQNLMLKIKIKYIKTWQWESLILLCLDILIIIKWNKIVTLYPTRKCLTKILKIKLYINHKQIQCPHKNYWNKNN
jgi:hypothetical protein